MKGKLRITGLFLILHMVISGVLWGCLLVYQRGYNTLHREGIAVASVRAAQDRTHVQILEGSYSFPSAWMAEESPVYFGAYLLADEALHFWMNLSGICY